VGRAEKKEKKRNPKPRRRGYGYGHIYLNADMHDIGLAEANRDTTLHISHPRHARCLFVAGVAAGRQPVGLSAHI